MTPAQPQAGMTTTSRSRYEELERAERKPQHVGDHSARWASLDPVEAVNGQTASLIAHFCAEKRISVAALTMLGARVRVGTGGRVELAFAGSNGNGIITAIKYRPIGGDSHESRAEQPSTWLRPIVAGDSGSLDWLLAEGETDAARLLDLLPPGAAVLVLPAGALTFKPEWAQRIPRGARVYLCHDADEAGDKGAEKAARIIGPGAIRLRPPAEGTDWCDWEGTREQFAELVRALQAGDPERPFSLSVDEFVALERPDVAALLLDEDGRPLIARNSLTLNGARGGQGKTTFFIDLALHLTAGVDYLCFKIPEPVSVLLIENEGPEEMFSEKLEARLEHFPHPRRARLAVHVADWGGFNLADSTMRQRLLADLAEHEYDLVFGDPLDSLGIEGVGSPEDTRNFLQLMKQTGLHRSVAWWLNTHPRKEKTTDALDEIAGAWGGKPDAVLLMKQLDDDRTQIRFPKLRWAKRGRRPAILLAFDPDTEAFSYLGEESEEERNYLAEIVELLEKTGKRPGGGWLTTREIAAKRDRGGIGASAATIKAVLEEHPDVFESRTGDAAQTLGRSARATVWQLHSECNSVDAVDDSRASGDVGSHYCNGTTPIEDVVPGEVVDDPAGTTEPGAVR